MTSLITHVNDYMAPYDCQFIDNVDYITSDRYDSLLNLLVHHPSLVLYFTQEVSDI